MIRRRCRRGASCLLASPVNGSHAAENLTRFPFGASILGAMVREEVLAGPPRRWLGTRELGVIAGRSRLGLGRLIGPLDEPNDGTIEVAETNLAGATDQIVLPLGHSQMLISALAAQQAAAFLRDGRFARL